VNTWCTNCGDEFAPVEGNEPPQDPDEPRFCSETCAEAWSAAVDAEEVYRESGTGAPVWL
jgi:hypothetical protein